MRLIAAAILCGLMMVGGGIGQAQAKGCLKGAAVGGVAGHMAGHHGVIGSAAGCAIGHHEATKNENEKAQQVQGDSANNKGDTTGQ